jgi:hypothetical protein
MMALPVFTAHRRHIAPDYGYRYAPPAIVDCRTKKYGLPEVAIQSFIAKWIFNPRDVVARLCVKFREKSSGRPNG